MSLSLLLSLLIWASHMMRGVVTLVRGVPPLHRAVVGLHRGAVRAAGTWTTKSRRAKGTSYLRAFDEEGEQQEVEEIRAPRASSKRFVATPFTYHEELDLRIEDVTNLGVGIARHTLTLPGQNASSSWVVMVPLVLPGELVRAKVFRNHDSYSEADLVEVLEASPDRVQPLCPYFSSCGGCQYQMMSVPAQRKWKRSQVQQLMQRLGGVDLAATNVAEVVGTDDVYGYRSKITPHYNAPRAAQDLKVGFQQRGTRVVIDIAQCVIATPRINAEYAAARQHLTAAVTKKLPKKGATLLFREGLGGTIETDFRRDMQQEVAGVTFTFKAGEFFQNNPHVLPLMVGHVLSLARGDGVEHLIDAYCGSGLFALCGSQHFSSVTGVEVSELATRAATANALANGIKNAKFLCGSSEAIFGKVQHLPRDQTAIILDPPRKGCDRPFLLQLFAFRPKKIVYVSCDPATQARDVKMIVEEGGYRITDVTPFDLFPQTRHIENVVAFVRD